MKEYNKQPLTYQQQINLLKSRGLIINDSKRAEKHLASISYYRLSAYMLPYRKRDNDGRSTDIFKENTTWEMVYKLYVLDRKLRLLIFDAIERLEIAVRTQIAYVLSHKYGAHWQDNPTIFKPSKTFINKNNKTITTDIYTDIQKHIHQQVNDQKAEAFIQHYISNYNNPKNPPSWMCIETLYFKQLSSICTQLKNRSDRSAISSYFKLSPETFCSWLHAINYLRNLCAHHSRVWNRNMNIVPEKMLYSKELKWISNPEKAKRSKIYYFLCILIYMMQTVNPSSKFTNRIKDLLTEYKELNRLHEMGFPENWTNEDIWKI